MPTKRTFSPTSRKKPASAATPAAGYKTPPGDAYKRGYKAGYKQALLDVAEKLNKAAASR